MNIKRIGWIETDFDSKFGIPRQSGLIDSLDGRIFFDKEYDIPEAFRGIEGFSHLWLIWEFSEAVRDSWSPTVRPPRLGGNTRMGVFATRSPFRPNALGLSCVRLKNVGYNVDGHRVVLAVTGADLMSGTPIIDIKPYLPLTDVRADALSGFAGEHEDYALEVVIPNELLSLIPECKRNALRAVLAHDPRPAYQNDPKRIYGFRFAGLEIKFTVSGNVLTVKSINNEQ